MVESISPADRSFALDILRHHCDRCKAQLRFLRETAGRREHRMEALDALRAARTDIALIEGGDAARAKAICEQLFEEPACDREGVLRIESTTTRRTPEELRETFRGLLSEHAAWLEKFEARHLRRWKQQLADDRMVEGAIWEALCRRWLARFVDSIEPEEDVHGGGPDFRCTTRAYDFYVEASCLSIDAITRATGLHDMDIAGGSYRLGTARAQRKVEEKVAQCGVRRDAPTILFLGTLHQIAAWIGMGERVAREFLTGEPLVAFRILMESGEQAGSDDPHSATKLHGATFVAADGPPGGALGPRNRHVAAVIVGNSGMFRERDPLAPPPFVGALHPDPEVAFDPLRALPGVPFHRLRAGWHRGVMATEPVQCRPVDRGAHHDPAH